MYPSWDVIVTTADRGTNLSALGRRGSRPGRRRMPTAQCDSVRVCQREVRSESALIGAGTIQPLWIGRSNGVKSGSHLCLQVLGLGDPLERRCSLSPDMSTGKPFEDR